MICCPFSLLDNYYPCYPECSYFLFVLLFFFANAVISAGYSSRVIYNFVCHLLWVCYVANARRRRTSSGRTRETRETRQENDALSICSLTSPPRSNVRLFSVIFLIIIATILFFVNVIVVLQHSLSPIFPCCRTRRRRKGDEFRST